MYFNLDTIHSMFLGNQSYTLDIDNVVSGVHFKPYRFIIDSVLLNDSTITITIKPFNI